MSRLIHKSHNVSILLYHMVCVAKYRRVVFDASVEEALREVCLEIALRYEIEFIEIGVDGDHVHFLVQSVPTYSPMKIVSLVQSLSARQVFSRCPQVKKKLWGGEFWSTATLFRLSGSMRVRKPCVVTSKNRDNITNISSCIGKRSAANNSHFSGKVTLL